MKHVVIIGQVFPEPKSTAAGTRMLQIIELLQEMQYKITYLSTSKISEFSYDLSLKNIQTITISINNSNVDELFLNLNPNIVVFDRFYTEEQFGWKISELLPNAIRILDTEDLHFLRAAREKSFKQGKNCNNSDLINDTFKREIASIYRCDLTLIISDFEMNLLKNTFKIDDNLLIYLPLMVESYDEGLKFSERNHFMSIGNFIHEPNWQTVLQLKKIWPNIRMKIPKAEIHIYGSYVSDKAKQLHQPKEGFLIKGRVENVEDIMRTYKVLLAPIPFGAGIKGKLLDAMQYGLPSITNSIGAEGMTVNNNFWNGAIVDSEVEFVKESIDVYHDEYKWSEAQKTGFSIIQTKFLKANYSKGFQEKIEKTIQNLEENRTLNFLGSVFQHQFLQSSKYMSKWIEEKNKRI